MVWNYLFEGTEIIFEEQLLEQIEKKNNENVGIALQEAKDLCIAVDVLGSSLLHYSAECGNESITKFLIKSGSKVNLQNNDGNTPLLLATKKQQVATIKVLLESDADIYMCDNKSNSALKVALHGGSAKAEVAKLFLQQVSNECLSDSSEIAKRLMKIECPLYIAVLLKNVDVTTCMISEGCLINAKDLLSGKTALHVVVENLDSEHVDKLVFLGADVNAKDVTGKTPVAMLNNFSKLDEAVSIAKVLVDGKAELNLCDEDGFMQIRTILQNGPSEVVELLLDAESCDGEKTDKHKQNVIHYLANNCNPKIALVTNKIFIMTFMNLNVRDENDLTALHCAMSVGNTSFVGCLIRNNANMNIATNDGVTPFLQAIESTNEDTLEQRVKCVKILLMNKAHPDILMGHYFKFYNTKSVVNRDYTLLQPVIAYLILWKELGNSINREVLSKIDLHPKLKEYFNLCTSELDKMKNDKFNDDNDSVFDFLTVNKNIPSTKNAKTIKPVTDKFIDEIIQKYVSISMYNSLLKENVNAILRAELESKKDEPEDDPEDIIALIILGIFGLLILAILVHFHI